jgi:chemotaxis protein MotC
MIARKTFCLGLTAIVVTSGIVLTYFLTAPRLWSMPWLHGFFSSQSTSAEPQDHASAPSIEKTDTSKQPDDVDGGNTEAPRLEMDQKVEIVAAIDFVKPKRQTSAVAKAMRKIYALQNRLARGERNAARDLADFMAETRQVFASVSLNDMSEADIALMAQYVFSGGDPGVALRALQSKNLEPQERELLEGAESYSIGELDKAREKLLPLTITDMDNPPGAQLAMTQVQIDENADPASKFERLRKVANVTPGTLIEDAAIRRMIPLLADDKETQALIYWAGRYQRRFSHSMYHDDFRTLLVDALARDTGLELSDNQLVFAKVFEKIGEEETARVSRGLLFKAVETGNRGLCNSVSDSLSAFENQGLTHNDDVRALISICGVADEGRNMEPVLAKIEPLTLSPPVRMVLHQAMALAQFIQQDQAENSASYPGPDLPLRLDANYAPLFASVAQQTEATLAVIAKADDNDTGANEHN